LRRQSVPVIGVRLSFAVLLLALIAIGCEPSASSPTPTVATPPAASPSRTASPSAPTRIQESESPIPDVAGAFVLFQLPTETGLRAVSFGGDVNGLLPTSITQLSGYAGWQQSPYGIPYILGSTVYDRAGRSLGALPWTIRQTVTWSADGRLLCAAVPERATTGAQMRLETAVPGQPAKLIASGFMVYSDNATYPVLACDTSTDRAIVASFGQGVAPSRLTVFRLSTGAIIRSVDYAGMMGWVAASADGTMLVETLPFDTASQRWSATIRSADDGTTMGRVDGFVAHGFSGDNSLLVGASESIAAVVDWKTGRAVWSTSGTYGGFLAEPAGRRLAVGIGFVGGSDQRDVYLVSADGSAALLPAHVRVALRY